MTRFACAVMFALVAACAAPSADERGEMLAVCRVQEAAWNRGDLEAFMAEGYWRSPELSFFSGGSDTRGFEAMLARYRERYQAGGREMGVLSFTELEAVTLAPGAGLARGRWKVVFSDGRTIEGLFSLAMRRFAEGWRIVHDHTSSAE